MKQIIPFKRELLFKTKVSEITSISLEHTLTLKEDDLISGEFHITGDYKMTEGSINREKFQFKLPFDIALDSKYDISSIIIDIDNFYYEIVNSEALLVNIDVYVEGRVVEDVNIIEDNIFNVDEIDDRIIEEDNAINDDNSDSFDFDMIRGSDMDNYSDNVDLFDKIENSVEKVEKINGYLDNNKLSSINDEFDLFENIDNSDTYVTYYVYVVKEDDTLDKILSKYQTTKEEVALYNSIDNIKPGTKLIIPTSCNE